MEKKLCILILLSSLLLGCRNEESKNKETLYFTSGYNENKTFFKYSFENERLTVIDSINFNDSINNLHFDNRFSNLLVGNTVISSFGVPFNLVEKKIVAIDSFVNSKEYLVDKRDNDLYFYNLKFKRIVSYNLLSNKILVDAKIKPFELQLFNFALCTEYISPNFKSLVKVVPKQVQDINSTYDIFIKSLQNENESKVLTSIHGTSMSKLSSTVSMPSLKWLNENEFIYADFKVNGAFTTCLIKRYNVNTNESLLLGEIDLIPLSVTNSVFEFDNKKNLFLKCKKGLVQIDYIKNNLNENNWQYDLGNGFKIIDSNKFKKIMFENKVIFIENKNEKLDSHWKNFKSTDGYLAFFIDKKNNDINDTSREVLIVVSQNADKKVEIDKEELTSILGWK
jgi:molybdopterin/thiamine biosynthesis adenylyltransferase